MKPVTYFLFLLILNSTKLFGQQQNLIPLCGFEDDDSVYFRSAPLGAMSEENGRISASEHNDKMSYHQMQLNYWKTYSVSGVAVGDGMHGGIFSGLIAVTDIYNKQSYRQFLSVPMCRPMRKDVTYSISFYLKPIHYTRKITSSISVYFSQAPFKASADRIDSALLSVKPSASGPADSFYGEKRWYRVDMKYIAKGGEQYFTLGNFIPYNQMRFKRVKEYKYDMIDYYIDDIKVFAPSDTFNCCNRCLLYSNYFTQPFSTDRAYPLPGIHFAWNDTSLADGCYPDLEAVKQLLDYFPNWKVRIIGHTDSTGDPAFNQLLSEGRARMVKSLLQKKGINQDRILATGKGATEPIRPNNSEKGREANRRVEIEFYE
jgi:hypothetical protein